MHHHRPTAAAPLALLALAACLAPSASAQAPLHLDAGPLAATVSLPDGHLGALLFEDNATHTRLQLDDAFSLELPGGRTLRASALHLVAPPAASTLAAEPAASRAAAHHPGRQLCADLDDTAGPQPTGLRVHWCLVARGDAPYLRQEVTFTAGATPLPVAQVELLRLHDPAAHVVGTVPGSPIVRGNFFLGFEHPLSLAADSAGTATASLARTLPIAAGQSVTYSSVVGIARPDQMRRDLLAYIELERAHPYRTFLHPNTWYDLGEGQRYTADQMVERINAFGTDLVTNRHVTLDSYLMDDGWDNTSSLWQFNPGFPDGLTPLTAAAKRYNYGVGIWLSPWGGYDKEKDERIAFGRANGYELVKNLYALSGPKYYAAFEKACLNFIDTYGVNQFKIDGTGNANSVFPGSLYDSDFAAAIHLIERLRQAEPNLFVNLTTGTKPSPFWLRYADSIYRSGEDHDFAGEGTWRQRWITYRDQETYRNIVQKGPLFPLNSLMLHGIIYAQKAEHLTDDPGFDFADEVHSYFGTGTDLQELYITPSLLTSANWDTLAEVARWSRENASILVDTHWVGGDPGKLEPYGWASWTPAKAILTLRNPSPQPQTITLDPAKVFELPPNAPTTYRAHSPWAADRGQPAITLQAGKPFAFQLKPFQVLNLDATPTT